MKDYRTWWRKAIQMDGEFDEIYIEVENKNKEYIFPDILQDNDSDCMMEQIWAMYVDLA